MQNRRKSNRSRMSMRELLESKLRSARALYIRHSEINNGPYRYEILELLGKQCVHYRKLLEEEICHRSNQMALS